MLERDFKIQFRYKSFNSLKRTSHKNNVYIILNKNYFFLANEMFQGEGAREV
jgi:hypothetical protein